MTEFGSLLRHIPTLQTDAVGKGKNCQELRAKKFKFDSDELLSQQIPKVIYNYGLGVLTIGSNGQMKTDIDIETASEMVRVARSISELSEKEAVEFDAVSSEVATICATALKVSKKNHEEFTALLKKYVVVELIRFGSDNKTLCIRKEGKMLDYKLNRIAKYLGIEIDLNKIVDFAVDYTRTSVTLNGNVCLDMTQPVESKGQKRNIFFRK